MNGYDSNDSIISELRRAHPKSIGGYNEILAADGLPRTHWASFVSHLSTLGQTELQARWNDGKRILRNHGVTYNVAAADATKERAWELDLIPFIISNEEWRQIESGVIQRAQLLNLVLQDIYSGPQYLLRNGLIPPALLFANPSFHRCCRGIPVPGRTYLHLHAVDLARAPDGHWCVLDTHTQNPKGVGYAIENRTIIGRLLNEAFRQEDTTPLSSFFTAMRRNLQSLAPSPTGWPRVVMLTPGVHSQAYYEHSLLSRYLGCTLVEGGDLVVRENKVHLKTVEGPQPVDVILRQVNDAHCDPLELREDSFLGVPGLVQSARAGKVLLANALGASIAESPALHASLPELARHLLSEELRLPSAPTWWCGEAKERDYVLENMNQLMIKNAFPRFAKRTQSGAELSTQALQEIKKAIQRRPYDFVGQAPIELSRVPVWTQSQFDARPVVLRVYVAAADDSYIVLPGGLTKVSSSGFSSLQGFQLAGGSKDTWIKGASSSAKTTDPIQLESRPAERIQTGVPSRAADNFFWLGRYAERLENLVQILASINTRLIEEYEPRRYLQALSLQDILGAFGFESTTPKETRVDIKSLIIDITYDDDCEGGVASLCRRTIELSTSIRDRFSGDAWKILSRLREFPGPRPERLPLDALQQLIHELKLNLAALTGIEAENMVRGPEWLFLNLGRRLERSLNLCHLMGTALQHPTELALLLNPLLEIADSTMSYRRQFYSEPEAHTVLETLLLDAQNPRALRYNLIAIKELHEQLPSLNLSEEASPAGQLIEEMIENIHPNMIDSLLSGQKCSADAEAKNPLDPWHQTLTAFSESLSQRYFRLLKNHPHANEFPVLPH